MDLLDRVGQKTRNKNSPDRMGLFEPQRRKAETLLLAWLSASLRSSRSSLRPAKPPPLTFRSPSMAEERRIALTVVGLGKARESVGFGSKADIASRPRHVRYSPQSGHSSARIAGLLSANNRHERRVRHSTQAAGC